MMMTRTQAMEVAVAATLVARQHPQLDHDEIGIFVLHALDKLRRDADLVVARDLADEASRITAKTFAATPASGAPSRMQRLETMLTQTGLLAEEIEREEGRAVHVLLLDESRNKTVRGVLAPTVTAYRRPVGH
ncbi:hypothetical protein [Sphingomonas sp. 3-13AW]|uniref:hypothetical protein n=1 Tax=Sphingomonas sp. 3-13AW TaxID=3050450 RepID=UPI003BB720C2